MNILIHIGYHKTGTTWLQKKLFTNPEMEFNPVIPKNQKLIVGSKQVKFGEKYFYAFSEISNDYIFDPIKVRDLIERECVFSDSKINVISNESLSGKGTLSYVGGRELCRRIHKLFPEGKILIGIREQKEMALSHYAQYLRMGGCLRATQYFTRSKGEYFPFSLNYGRLFYDVLIQDYIELFGRENVLVFPLEDWRKGLSGFLSRLENFLGISIKLPHNNLNEVHNRKIDFASLGLVRRFSPLLLSVNGNAFSSVGLWNETRKVEKIYDLLSRIIPSSYKESLHKSISNTVANSLNKMYCDSNKRTSQLIGMNLKEYGYDVD